MGRPLELLNRGHPTSLFLSLTTFQRVDSSFQAAIMSKLLANSRPSISPIRFAQACSFEQQ